MRIACAACNAVYDLPAERLRPGTAVRCIRCKAVWVPVEREDAGPPMPVVPEPVAAQPEPLRTAPLFPGPGEEPEPPPVPAAAPILLPPTEPPPPQAAAPPAPPRRRSWAAVLAWVFSILVLAGVAAAAVAYRPAVVAAWPASERGYRLLGLP